MSEIQTEDGSEYQVIVGSTRGHLPARVARQQSQPSGRSKSSSQYATQE